MVSLWRSAVTSTAGNNPGVFFQAHFSRSLLQKFAWNTQLYMSKGYFVLPRISMDIIEDASVAGQSPQEHYK